MNAAVLTDHLATHCLGFLVDAGRSETAADATRSGFDARAVTVSSSSSEVDVGTGTGLEAVMPRTRAESVRSINIYDLLASWTNWTVK